VIRIARLDDAAAIAAVHVRGWQAAYRDYLPQDFLDGMSVVRRAQQWTTWLADLLQTTAVSETEAGIVGFVNIGASRDLDASPMTGELMSIYVEPSVWRHNIGRGLVAWATAAAVAREWTMMTLWTIADNTGARAFYERCGWSLDGASKREQFAGRLLSQVRYAWYASEAGPGKHTP
jgi:GNAT superfamily N-acetyltransferase